MEYISHTDYKNLMSKFQAETPKGLLKEAIETVKDTSNYNASVKESEHDDAIEFDQMQAFKKKIIDLYKQGKKEEAIEMVQLLGLGWTEDLIKRIAGIEESKDKKDLTKNKKDLTADNIRDAINSLDLDWKDQAKVVKALDHVDVSKYKGMTAKQAAEEIKDATLDEVEEGLNFPTKQATGQTIMANEDQAPFGLPSLSITEREQLKQCIESYKTIKEEINKLLEKAGKGKMMETKKQKPGGPRTGLVMTSAVTSENEEHKGGEHEEIGQHLGDRLHDAFGKVSKMAVDKLKSEGLTDGEIQAFLQHEIEEVVKGEIGSQYDL